MQNEPFYHLIPYADRVYDGTHSMLAVESAFQGIQLDSELMQLIIQPITREQLKELLVGMVWPPLHKSNRIHLTVNS